MEIVRFRKKYTITDNIDDIVTLNELSDSLRVKLGDVRPWLKEKFGNQFKNVSLDLKEKRKIDGKKCIIYRGIKHRDKNIYSKIHDYIPSPCAIAGDFKRFIYRMRERGWDKETLDYQLRRGEIYTCVYEWSKGVRYKVCNICYVATPWQKPYAHAKKLLKTKQCMSQKEIDYHLDVDEIEDHENTELHKCALAQYKKILEPVTRVYDDLCHINYKMDCIKRRLNELDMDNCRVLLDEERYMILESVKDEYLSKRDELLKSMAEKLIHKDILINRLYEMGVHRPRKGSRHFLDYE